MINSSLIVRVCFTWYSIVTWTLLEAEIKVTTRDVIAVRRLCLCSDSHFEHTLRLTFEPFLFCVWGVYALGAIPLKNIRPGAYWCSVCSLFKLFVLRFDVSSDESQTVFGLVCDSGYVRWPIEVTTDSEPEKICIFCGSEGGVMKCIWENNRFLFFCVL